MDAVLDFLASAPGPWAFALMVSCGLGGPPWSEEIVLLGSGYFVASGAISYGSAVLWNFAGILAGDSVVYLLGRTVGEKVYRWPVLRRHMNEQRQARFQRRFRRDGVKAVFMARFLPGFRMVAYFVAGNLRMQYWKFVLLDFIGALLTVPVSIWLGRVFAENLDHAKELLHRYQIPVAIVAGLLLAGILWRGALVRKNRLRDLREHRSTRRSHTEKGTSGENAGSSPDSGPIVGPKDDSVPFRPDEVPPRG